MITAERSGARVGLAALRVTQYVGVVAICVLIALPTLNFPFGPDQAIFATIGQTISRGGFPYTDAWDQKPPAIFLIYAVAIHGPFSFMRNVRIFDIAWMAVTVLLLIELGRRWWSARAGMTAGLLYGAIYTTASGWWNLAQPDGFIALPLVAALLLYDGARGRAALLIGAGVALGVAFQLRFIMALLIPFFPLVELGAAPHGERARLWFRRMLWLGVGFVLVQAALALWLALGGALGEYVAATRFASGYTSLGGPYSPKGLNLNNYTTAVRFSFLFWLLTRLVVAAPALIGGFAGVFLLHERRVQQVTLFVFLGFLGICAQAKFFPYHWLYLLPFLALLAGWTFDRVLTAVREREGPARTLLAGGLLASGLLLSTPDVLDGGWFQWSDYVHFYSRPAAREYYYDDFGNWNGGAFSYRASRDTAAYLQAHTRPGDPLYIWGYDPLVYLLAERPSASRFIYAFPLMSGWAPKAWQPDFLEELKARPPAYFVVQHNEGAPWITGHGIDTGGFIPWFPQLESWLKNNYSWSTTIEDYDIYRRLPAGSAIAR